ncbi:MAG: hypothetical protein P8166_14030 [Candidatus Thiodiazotropha sp.]
MQFFGQKGLKPTFSWMDMLADAHDQAFTVAKMMDVDLLAEVSPTCLSSFPKRSRVGSSMKCMVSHE